jgi:predicted ArsR family transcriptional regulator
VKQLPLPILSPLARRTDPETSHEAARVVREKLTVLQQAILEAFRDVGPMSARQAERLGVFGLWGFSTVRKRISELAAAGLLEEYGSEKESGRTGATVYRLRA